MEINGLVKRIHANNGTKYRNNDQKYCGNSKTRIPRHVINNNSIATTQTRRPIQTRSLAIVTLYNYMDPTTYETSSTRERTKPTPKVLPVMSFGFTGQLCTAKAENKAENNKQRATTLSTTEAELVAASDCVKMLLYIRRLLTEDFRMNIRTHYPTWGRQARVHSFSTRRWQLEKKETYSCGKQLFVRRSHHTCQWPYGT